MCGNVVVCDGGSCKPVSDSSSSLGGCPSPEDSTPLTKTPLYKASSYAGNLHTDDMTAPQLAYTEEKQPSWGSSTTVTSLVDAVANDWLNPSASPRLGLLCFGRQLDVESNNQSHYTQTDYKYIALQILNDDSSVANLFQIGGLPSFRIYMKVGNLSKYGRWLCPR